VTAIARRQARAGVTFRTSAGAHARRTPVWSHDGARQLARASALTIGTARKRLEQAAVIERCADGHLEVVAAEQPGRRAVRIGSARATPRTTIGLAHADRGTQVDAGEPRTAIFWTQARCIGYLRACRQAARLTLAVASLAPRLDETHLTAGLDLIQIARVCAQATHATELRRGAAFAPCSALAEWFTGAWIVRRAQRLPATRIQLVQTAARAARPADTDDVDDRAGTAARTRRDGPSAAVVSVRTRGAAHRGDAQDGSSQRWQWSNPKESLQSTLTLAPSLGRSTSARLRPRYFASPNRRWATS